jgi:predicted esterase
MTFEELGGAVFALCSQGRYEEAIGLIEQEGDALRGHEARGVFWTACLRSVAGDPDHALAVLREALDRGLWWSPVSLEWDSDLEALRAHPEFRELVEASGRKMRGAATADEPVMVVRDPEHPTGAVLLALHGASSSAATFAPRWEAAAALGVIVAVPQSPYASTSDGDAFTWPEPGVEEEVTETVARLREQRPVHLDRVVLAGFSQGGRLAVDMALRGEPFPVRGVITVAAGLGPGTEVPGLRRGAPRFWFLTGERDVGRDAIEAGDEALQACGFDSRLEVMPGLGHAFPDDFQDRLPEALEFVLGNG